VKPRTRLKHVEQLAGTKQRILHVLSLPSHASETRSELIAEAFANSGIAPGDQDVVLFTGVPHRGAPHIANSILLRD
jgi:hypothetical protein